MQNKQAASKKIATVVNREESLTCRSLAGVILRDRSFFAAGCEDALSVRGGRLVRQRHRRHGAHPGAVLVDFVQRASIRRARHSDSSRTVGFKAATQLPDTVRPVCLISAVGLTRVVPVPGTNRGTD